MGTLKKRILKASVFVSILTLFAIVFYYDTLQNRILKTSGNDHQEEAFEEEPHDDFPKEAIFEPFTLKGEALAKYKTWKQAIEASGYKFTDYNTLVSSSKSFFKNLSAAQPPNNYAYANNAITGSWNQKNMVLYDDSGFRADGSTYDPINDILYVVSTAGHLYKIDESAPIKWALRNHNKNLLGDDFNGINLPDNSFRLLHQKTNGAMEFSDDEGRTWVDANGALFQSSWNNKTLVTKTPTGRRIVAHGGSYVIGAAYERLFISTDYGLNYTESSFRFKKTEFDVSICKTHNSNTVYCFARRKSDSKLLIYKMGENDSDFSLLSTSSQSFTSIDAVFGTKTSSGTHFYISYGPTNIYYSNNEGQTWILTSNSNDGLLMDIHPTEPNICYKGFIELFMSTDYGSTWSKNFHKLKSYYVWDLQHMQTYDKENGGNITFVGMDFGSYHTTNPKLWNSWVSINQGSPNILAYDAVTSELNNKLFTANQDRGSLGFTDTPNSNGMYYGSSEAGTDILRVELSKDEKNVWFWYYYGTIGHANVLTNNAVSADFYSSWWATSMVASPDVNEDAIYIPAGGTQLNKFTFNSGSITRSFHPYTFSGAPISFAYSNLNTNRWYVGLKTGPFMYSTDGGNTFTPSSYTGTWPGQDDTHRKRRTVIATSTTNEATVYFAGKGNIFLVSNDGGATFTNRNTGLSVTRFADLSVSPNGKYVFAACEDDGAWVYSVDQDRWFKMSGADVPNVQFTDVQFIKSKNLVRFATYGSGVIDFIVNENLLSSTKITDPKTGTVKAFPNPNTGVFEITVPNIKSEIKIDLYSETGALISKQTYKQTNGKVTLNIHNKPDGIYIAKVYLEKPISVKIIKK